jgi:hypothetical protein
MTAQDAKPPKSTSGAVASFKTAVGDAYRGFFDITHNSLALLGTLAAVALITLSARADLRASAEEQLLGWLLERQEAASADAVYAAEPSAIDRVTAAQPGDLPKQQANVTYWLSRKYRVAPEPLSVLVAEAFEVGEKAKLDPTLILAVMAIESRFNPFAQSPVGAQGPYRQVQRLWWATRRIRSGVQPAGGRAGPSGRCQARRLGRRGLALVRRCGHHGRQLVHRQGDGRAPAHPERGPWQADAALRASSAPDPRGGARCAGSRNRGRGAGRAERPPPGLATFPILIRPTGLSASAKLAGYATGDRRAPRQLPVGGCR